MTTRTTVIAIATLCASTVASSASTVQQVPESAHKTVLLTGCLQLADTKEYFTLREAASISRTTPEQLSRPGSAPREGKQAAERIEYELRPVRSVGESGIDAKQLAQHVGQRVEVTARPTEDTAPAPPDPKVTPEQPKPKGDAVQKIRLTVTAIKSLGMCT